MQRDVPMPTVGWYLPVEQIVKIAKNIIRRLRFKNLGERIILNYNYFLNALYDIIIGNRHVKYLLSGSK